MNRTSCVSIYSRTLDKEISGRLGGRTDLQHELEEWEVPKRPASERVLQIRRMWGQVHC